jgi:hypothetical protein
VRNKLVLALVLFGAVAVTTASVPQKASSLSQNFDDPMCDCMQTIGGVLHFGVKDPLGVCHIDKACRVPGE